MKKQIHFLLALLVISSYGIFSQTDSSVSIEADFNVSPSGALTYSVPFEVPSYVLGHFPDLGLSFNSQAGDGIAGYGWSITGLSSITRTPATAHHDGFIDEVDFDLDDRYALDGQRLMLKTGTYGVSGSSYQTEQFSNVKIEAVGTSKFGSDFGPKYFVAYHPNGLRYWYGGDTNSTSAHSKLEWSIAKIEDSQGNSVRFNYSTVNSTLRLDSVRDQVAGVFVVFAYNTKTNVNKIGIGGDFFVNDRLLNNVTVFVNYYEQYMKYESQYKSASDNTYLLENINKINRSAKTASIKFNYADAITDEVERGEMESITSGSLGHISESTVLSGDFNGDEQIDFMAYNRDRDDNNIFQGLNFYMSGTDYISGGLKYYNTSIFNDGNFEQILTGRVTDLKNELSTNNILIALQKVQNKHQVKFTAFSVEGPGAFAIPKFIREVSFSPPIDYDSKDEGYLSLTQNLNDQSVKKRFDAGNIEARNKIYGPVLKEYMGREQVILKPGFIAHDGSAFKARVIKNNDIGNTVKMRYLSGDFNGDGITEIIALTHRYFDGKGNCRIETTRQRRNGRWVDVEEEICDNNVNNSRAFLIDFNPKNQRDNSKPVGILDFDISDHSGLHVLDFDGDGKQEILLVSNTKFNIYGLNKNNRLVKLGAHTFRKKPQRVLPGDYNGDGKTDLLVATDTERDVWDFYISKGNSVTLNTLFESHTEKSIGTKFYHTHGAEKDEFYQVEGYHYPFPSPNGQIGNPSKKITLSNTLRDFRYFAVDFNNDGKTDIIRHQINTPLRFVKDQEYRMMHSLQKFEYVTNHSTKNNFLDFNRDFYFEIKNQGRPYHGHSGYASVNNQNLAAQYVYANENGGIFYYDYRSNLREQKCISSTENNGLVTEFEYHGLTPSTERDFGIAFGSTYSDYIFNDDKTWLDYPFYKLPKLDGFKVVKSVKQSFNGFQKTKDFAYSGLVGNVSGIGIIGFTGMAQTNWYGTNVGTNWQIATYDYKKRGTLVSQYAINGDYPFGPSFSDTNYTYKTVSLANKVYGYFPTKIESENTLNGITNTTSLTYDSYYNVLTSTSNHNDGGNKITHTYFNNPSGTGTDFYIGRPKTKVETTTLGSESFTTSEEYSYTNNLITQLKTKGNGTSWLTETYTHDTFGNITSKTISGDGIENRTELTSYDEESGRFLLSATDIDNLTTSYTYDYRYGHLLSETDPFEKTQSFEYDSWNRLTKQTDFLDNTINTSYAALPGGGLKVTTSSSLGGEAESYTNRMGWEYLAKERNALNEWVSVSKEYDLSGKTRRESQPYKTAATQWTSIGYDSYNRPKTQTLYTGQVITTTYGYMSNSVTVDDGTKTVTSVRDAVDNIVSMTDPGGTINYTYYANNTPKETDYQGHKITTKIDGWGRKIELNDPAAGVYSYSYNILGEMLTETTPKGTTTYELDAATGRPLKKSIVGDNTDIELTYTYHPTHKQITYIAGADRLNHKNYSYNYTYDANERLTNVQEVTPHGATFYTSQSYDPTNGRILSQATRTVANGQDHTVVTRNKYHTSSGQLIGLTDSSTNSVLGEIKSLNARGQVLQASTAATGIIAHNDYDAYGLFKRLYTKKSNNIVTDIAYDFDEKRGNLRSRNNANFSKGQEVFTYDSLDRLTGISGAYTHTQTYDNFGRIDNNSQVGTYNYQANTRYRIAGVSLNNTGKTYFETRSPQQITYNAYKKPISIYQQGHGRVDFEYGPMMNRSVAYYGGSNTNVNARDYKKIYSAIAPVEVIIDKATNDTKIITYADGDAYNASVAHVKQTGASAKDEYLYLFRDHLGSIMSIFNEAGNIIESTHYGAWGSVEEYSDIANNQSLGYASILGRGYTGHEHFESVGLIHMNGRMYDAKLGRFLSPDNFIQDPFNTQSFNRYGYVLNNPLKYNDPSGEIIGIIIGAVVGAYLGGALTNSDFNPFNWDFGSFETWAGIVVGGALGAFAGGQIAAGKMSLLVSAGSSVKGVTVPLAGVKITAAGFKVAVPIIGTIADVAFRPRTKREGESATERESSSSSPYGNADPIGEALAEDHQREEVQSRSVITSDDVMNVLTDIWSQGLNSFFNPTNRNGKFWSFSTGGAVGGGLGYEIGLVRDAYGNRSFFFTLSGNAGLNSGSGFNTGDIIPTRNHAFRYTDFGGNGAGYNIGVGPFGIERSGNFIDGKSQNFFDYGDNERGYLVESGGFSTKSYIPKRIDFGFGASIFRTRTWTFFRF